MKELSFKVAEFDAPLDLILHLISKHKLDILDIDISSLLEQYMEYMDSMREQKLDIASEFLQMASRLVYMKSLSLLPRHEEETEKLKQELSGQLVEYGICKLVAKMLAQQNVMNKIFVRQPMPVEYDPKYRVVHSPMDLYKALIDAVGKGARRLPPPAEAFAPIVERAVVSVNSKIFSVLRILRKTGSMPLEVLWSESDSRSSVVASFLAVLELVKSYKVVITENEIMINS